MTKYTFSYLALAVFTAVMTAGGCANGESISAKTEPTNAHTHKGAAGYKKPGAAIDYFHDYDGKSQPGDIENITLTLTEPYESGTLSLEISEHPSLIFYSATRNVQFDMNGADSHVIDLQIGTPQGGKYYLNYVAKTDDGHGQIRRRSFAIALNVGNSKTAAAAAPLDRKGAIAAKDGRVIMQAQETVTVLDW